MNFKIEFTDSGMAYVIGVLKRQVWEDANPLLMDIDRQTREQRQAASAPVVAPVEPPVVAMDAAPAPKRRGRKPKLATPQDEASE